MIEALNPRVEEALERLQPKRREFVIALKCGDTRGNAHHAYRKAGYRANGRAADSAVSRLLADVNIKAAIAAFDESALTEIIKEDVDYQKEWYRDMQSDLDAARADGAHGPVMTGNKLLASSKRYDLEVNKVTHDLAPELRNAIADRIAGARARTINLNEGEEE